MDFLIISAAKAGISLEGSTLYVSMTPCSTCAKALIAVGVSRIVAAKRYHSGEESEYLFGLSGIPLDIIDSSVVEYANQKVEADPGKVQRYGKDFF